jgi:hypothetical protein
MALIGGSRMAEGDVKNGCKAQRTTERNMNEPERSSYESERA